MKGVLSVKEEHREGVLVGRIRKINKRVKRVRQTLNAGGEVLHYHNMLLFLSCPFLQIYIHIHFCIYIQVSIVFVCIVGVLIGQTFRLLEGLRGVSFLFFILSSLKLILSLVTHHYYIQLIYYNFKGN